MRGAYKFQPGALDIICQEKNLRSEKQLARALGITLGQLDKIRHGALVGAPMALHVSDLMGEETRLWAGLAPAHMAHAA